MMLLHTLDKVLQEGWDDVFAQKRTLARAREHAIGLTCCFGRRTISRTICAMGRQNQDWSADYKIYSRSPWKEDELFDPVITEYLKRYPRGYINVAFDDTMTPKQGKKIKDAFWQRDPMSPPFHVNLIWGLRFAQASMLFSHYHEGNFDARAIPLRFWDAPALRKPGKRASEEKKKHYKEMKKTHNLSVLFLAQMRNVRKSLDDHGAYDRKMLSSVDGSLCNQTIFKGELDRTEIIARCRKDARLCFPAPPGSRRKYGQVKFTPEDVRQDETIPWETARIHFGGAWRPIRYKEVNKVYWQRGAGRKELRLIVIAPQPYKLSRNSRTNYRKPSYQLSTDTTGPVTPLIQAYFDRLQIEVNNREEKDILGVGQAQVWSEQSVSRQPAFAVAVYSMLLLASIKAYGPGRTDDYIPLPKWRKNARRPSILDLITLVRKDINETQNSGYADRNIPQNTAMYAYT
jgi:hypothetical protein